MTQGDGTTKKVLWRLEGDAFGDAQPTNPTTTAFTMPLRMAGQYYDSEVGISNNYFRDYDPSTGRYVESDPIGLGGGNNTYGYVRAKPLQFFDSKGLVEWSGSMGGAAIAGIVGGGVFPFKLTSECMCGKKVTIHGYASAIAAPAFGMKIQVHLELAVLKIPNLVRMQVLRMDCFKCYLGMRFLVQVLDGLKLVWVV